MEKDNNYTEKCQHPKYPWRYLFLLVLEDKVTSALWSLPSWKDTAPDEIPTEIWQAKKKKKRTSQGSTSSEAMPANLENDTVADWLVNVNLHSNTEKMKPTTVCKLLYNILN